MNNGFFNPGNPWGMSMMPSSNIDNLYAAYKQMQAQMQQGNNQPVMNVTPAMGQRGTWQQVKEYKEVENCPVPTDGTPTLFFDFEHGVFYSKKFANGQCCIQDFYFGPTGSQNSGSQKEEPLAPSSIDAASIPQAPQEGLLEATLSALLDKMDDIGKKLSVMNTKLSNQAKTRSAGD